ncbi:Hsp33 family molecular chaperone HslO [Alteraurantiacibacter aquimixticola]|uniref:Hsp33 family molecular chaperone HslO n=1 Tax=Alteraurantiacibacter aquimixticola TaxID=2489173 RepID=A0A4V4U8C3_9SPHN|nr:Hsp33 family molecular chaperone HslO [Alteraurantiacibacter aquimixticola]TIX49370.1 Hsp33 family molecular chaperone HslO [Alteraurantiacibacter aquimixticola]
MAESSSEQPQTGFDQILSFTIPERDCRGRMVRLGPVLDTILGAHDYPPAIKHVLAEALVLTALMGGLLKEEEDQLTMQAQAQDGVITLLVCDYRQGELRGYVEHDPAEFDTLGSDPTLADIFGTGYLAITFDIAKTGQRYQGVVPLEGESLTDAVEAYFAQSEQVPTFIHTAGKSGASGNIGGGLLVQHLPEGEEGRERLHAQLDHPHWEHVAVLAESLSDEELIEQGLSLEELLWRLYHDEREIRVEQGAKLMRGCRCSEVYFEEVLARFPKEDRRDMADENGIIMVDCAFCSKQFPIQD